MFQSEVYYYYFNMSMRMRTAHKIGTICEKTKFVNGCCTIRNCVVYNISFVNISKLK